MHQCLGHPSTFRLQAVFTSQNSDLAEDGWVTMNKNGKWSDLKLRMNPILEIRS